MVYTAYPDAVLDVDRGSSKARSKKAAHVEVNEYDDRDQVRKGYRDMDERVSGDTRYSPSQRDSGRSSPRETNADLRHERMERKLPPAGVVRQPISSRQRKARSIAKRTAQAKLSRTQYGAMQGLLTDDGWQATGDALSDVAGDAQLLDPDQLRNVQRIDRAIQAFERGNDRGHVVYANVEMPWYINSSNVVGYVEKNLPAGREVAFDRYTAGAHCMHEVEPDPERANRTVVMEIQTRRGMYLGGSDSVDRTGHLLPRGMRMRIAGSHTATYQRPDGSTAQRVVLQMTDTPETETRSWRDL